MLCTSGIWTVKAGREDDFARRWEESASNLSLEFPDVTFRLLRDHDESAAVREPRGRLAQSRADRGGAKPAGVSGRDGLDLAPARVGRDLDARADGGDQLMEQRVSLVTLGVADLARARAFYEALGWTTGAEPEDDVVFFQAGG